MWWFDSTPWHHLFGVMHMNKPVLFAGTRPYRRAENISALFNAYQGEKRFIEVHGDNNHPEITSGKYDILVIDDFPSKTPGKCIMIWHAIQGGKCIGYDQPHPYINPSKTSIINYIIAAGDGAIPMWKKCTRLQSNRVLPLGMPRTDIFIGKKKGDGHTILANKRAYLYVPTFRWPDEPAPFILNYDWLDQNLTDDELFVVKAHTVSTKILNKEYKHIIEIPSSEPSTPYLYDCDVVITDYSSIIFDGYLLGKPSILFEQKCGYPSYRGMYMQYPKEYSSRYVMNEQDLLYVAREASCLTAIERDCINKLANACDGNSCQRICDLISKLNT